MNESLTIRLPSPNMQHHAQLVAAGEIRFGPLYYSLLVDGDTFGDRIFGDVLVWSPDSTVLAVQEWYTIDYGEGPITGLVMIDIQQRREAVVTRVTKEFVVPEAFEGLRLMYRIDTGGRTGVEHLEIDIAKLTAWQRLP